LNYELAGLQHGSGLIGGLTGGWGISGTSIFQSGYPAMVWNSSGRFIGACASATNCPSVGTPYIGYAAAGGGVCATGSPATSCLSGDYNADGDTAGVGGVGIDFPDVSNYHESTSKAAFLTGAFSASQFTVPAFGTEGNEKPNAFSSPNFAETDLNFYKNTRIGERVNFQLRFEFFNIFNRVNLTAFDTNLPDASFGEATQQQLPRNWQVGARFTF